MRFNRGLSPSRYHRSSKVFRDEFLRGRSFQDAFEECDVVLVYRVADGLTGVCAEPVTDQILIQRVQREIERKWVYVNRKQERAAARAAGIFDDDAYPPEDDEKPAFWQMFVGGKETTEIVFEEPPPLPPQSPIRLASVTTDAELAALSDDAKLWASQVRTRRDHTLPSAAEMDSAAIVIQARTRGLLSRIYSGAKLASMMMVQRGCHRWVSRQIYKKKRTAWLKRKAEEEAEAALKARYAALVNKGLSLGNNMNGLLDDMHKIVAVNESELKGSAGWAVYEKSRKTESDAALKALNDSITEKSPSAEPLFFCDFQ